MFAVSVSVSKLSGAGFLLLYGSNRTFFVSYCVTDIL